MDIYVINLDRRPDRLQQISSHLAALGLPFRRAAAVDGASLEEDSLSVVDRGTQACWYSHQSVFQLIANGSGNNALVLEDDAVLVADRDWTLLLNSLDEFMSRSSIDVLQLGFVEPEFTSEIRGLLVGMVRKVSAFLLRIFPGLAGRRPAVRDDRWDCLQQTPKGLDIAGDDFGGGTHCYVISRRAARAFMHVNVPVFLAADDFFYSLTLSAPFYRSFRIARLTRSLALQRGRSDNAVTDSDLEPFIARFIDKSRNDKC